MKQNNETKAMPRVDELEEAVVGALMLDASAIYKISAILKPHHLGQKNLEHIYTAILELYNKGLAIDVLTVVDKLQDLGTLEKAGGPYNVVSIQNRVASAANIEHHAFLILQSWMRRATIELSAKMQACAFDQTKDEFELLNEAQIGIESILNNTSTATQQTNQSIAEALMERIENNASRGSMGAPLFGIPSLDTFLDGASEDDFIIIAGRPAMGKSSLINSAIKYHVINKIPALFWSCEMTNISTMARALAGLSGIPYNRIMKKQFFGDEESVFMQWLDAITESPIVLEQSAGINALDFKNKVVMLQKKQGIKAAFIDRIGLLDDMPGMSHDNKSSRVGASTKIFRQMAVNLGIPIIAINQLSRAVESRPLKIPMLSDLRESGNIEQDATKVLLVYRPEYYGIMEDDEGASTVNRAYVICAKNTNGKTGTVSTGFSGEHMLFFEPEQFYNITPF